MKKISLIIVASILRISCSWAQSEVSVGTKIDNLAFTDHLMNAPVGSDFNDKFKVLEFWATWCGPCIKAVPHLNELSEAFVENKDLAFLSVTYEKPEQTERLFKRIDFKTIVVSDQTQKVFENLGVKKNGVIAIPQTFLVDNNNIVRWKGKPSELTEDLIRRFLRGEQI